MGSVFYVNGTFLPENEASIPIDERGHQFGDGVYEVVRVYGGRPFLLDWHLERLQRSCAGIALENPMDNGQWTELINEAIRRSGEPEATVYWQVTRGIAPRLHLFPSVKPSVTLSVRPVRSTKTVDTAGTLFCYPDERWSNAWIKSINLLPNVIAKEVAHQLAASEALLVREGNMTEGSSSNAWFVKGKEIFTAPTDRYILGGITRRYVLQLAQELGYTVYEQSVILEDLPGVDEVFMTSTTMEVLPIERIFADTDRLPLLDDLPDMPSPSLLRIPEHTEVLWEGTSFSVARQLAQAYREAVEKFRNYEDPAFSS